MKVDQYIGGAMDGRCLLLRGALALLVALASQVVARQANAAPCTYYASPSAPAPSLLSRPRGTAANPIRIEDFWSRAKPGDTLCLTIGIYTRPSDMITPPDGLSGRPGAPITVRAEQDGAVLIDGGARTSKKILAPVHLRNNDYFVLEGFDVGFSNTAVLKIGGTWNKKASGKGIGPDGWDPIEHVKIRRVVAWNANPRFDEFHACTEAADCEPTRKKGWSANFHVVDIYAARDVLVEDVAAFGTGRKVFQVFMSKGVTLRRAWGRWEGNASTHAQTFSCAYRSYDSLCENVIGTWSGQQQDPKIDIQGQLKSVLGMDWWKREDTWHGRSDSFDSGLRVLGSLGYVLASAKPAPENVVVFGYGKNQLLQDIVGYSEIQTQSLYTFNLTGCLSRVNCAWTFGKSKTDAPLRLQQITAIGGTSRLAIDSDWSRMTGASPPAHQPSLAAPRPNVFSDPSSGARLCHRYVDGLLTNEPLWPWPMNERIRSATWFVHGEATDVQAEVEQILGPIPAGCRTAPTESVAPNLLDEPGYRSG